MAETRAADVFEYGQLPGSLELAFVGDSVYDLFIRSHLVKKGGRIKEIHKAAVQRVNAHAQSESLSLIEDLLTEEETKILRRARNAKQTPTKNADAGEYHRATALEALIGYLYVTGRRERLDEMLKAALRAGGIEVTEEEMSFLGSALAEAAILREKSGYNQQVAMLKAFGLSEAAAKEQAARGVIDEAWQTAVQSFLSGGMMSGATSLYSKAVNNVQEKQLQGTIQEALKVICPLDIFPNGN